MKDAASYNKDLFLVILSRPISPPTCAGLDVGLLDENSDVSAHLRHEARDGAPHGSHLERDQVVDHLERGEGGLGAVAVV